MTLINSFLNILKKLEKYINLNIFKGFKYIKDFTMVYLS